MPNNAEDWGRYLSTKTLPSPFRVGKLVLKAIGEKDLSYANLAEQLNSDPVLSYYIMSKANQEKPDSNPTSKTLDHAISMIGMESLIQIIKTLPFQDSSSEDIKSFYFVRTLSTSLYAAHLGRAICHAKKIGHEEDIFWSSLFLGVPVWAMWRFATPEMRLIRYAIRNNFKLPPVAEKEVLGCTLFEASAAMIQTLGLSDLVKDCYNPRHQLSHKQWISIAKLIDKEGNYKRPSEDKELLMRMQTPQFMVLLSNMIAHYSTHDWYSRSTLRSQRILAAFLKVPLVVAIRITHQAAAEMSRAHPMPGVMLPAAKLFLDPRKRTKASRSEQKKADEASVPATENSDQSALQPPKQKEAASLENSIFKEVTDIMQLKPMEFSDLHEVMNAASQGIAYGLNLEHTAVSLINKDATRLKNYYTVGCRENKELQSFETPIIRNTIFHKLIEKPASVWVKPNGSDKVAKLIPMNFKQVIEVDEFILMSVFVGKRAVAIFYADNNGDPITEHQYKRFKFMCGAVSNALLHQANAKKKKIKR